MCRGHFGELSDLCSVYEELRRGWNFMNLRKFVFCLASAAVLASSFVFWACGDSSDSSPYYVNEDPYPLSFESSSSSEASSSSAKVSSSSAVALSSSAKNVPSSSSEKVAESSSAGASSSSAKSEPESSDSGVCTNCDSFTAADPVLVENAGWLERSHGAHY